MAAVSNTPQERLILRMAARKSWALGLYLHTETGAPIDVTDAVITLVTATVSPGGTITPVLTSTAEPVAPMSGHVRFSIQAEDTDLAEGEYRSTITMRVGGYSVVLADGDTEILPNTEVDSVGYDYDEAEDAGKLEVWLKRRNVIKISAPVVETKGNQGDQGIQGPVGPAGPGIAAGGYIGAVLVKIGLGDYVTGWVAPESVLPIPTSTISVSEEGDHTVIEFVPVDDIGLSAVGTDEGMVPRAIGSDMWGWDHLSAEDINDTAELVMMTIEERDKLAGISGSSLASSDWEALEDEDGFIFNKPELGTAAAADATDFRAADWVPSLGDLSDVDIVFGDVPESGPPGTFVIVLPVAP